MLFDTAVCGQTQAGVVALMASSSVDSSNKTLKILLAIGVDPDLPTATGVRPSHYCGFYGNVKSARCIFPCRPDMTADANEQFTPLSVARSSYKVFLFDMIP